MRINLDGNALFRASEYLMHDRDYASFASPQALRSMVKQVAQIATDPGMQKPDTAKALGLNDLDDVALLMNEAKALAPRLYDACRSGDLSQVFPSFALPART